MVKEIRIKMPKLGTRKLYDKIQVPLNEIGIGRDRLFAILRANHMLIKPKRQYHITTNSYHRFYKHQNLISTIIPSRPEQIWVSDITYVGNRKNPIYLALITDAYSKKIVGYDVSDSLCVKGTIRALNKAVKNRMYKLEPLIHHSDRGIQYCSDDYQKMLDQFDIKPSMTQKYDPYENAIAERINGILKQEFDIDKFNLNLQTTKKLVKDSIEIYNKERPHLSNSMLTPQQMHKQRQVKIIIYRKTKKSNKNQFATLL